jgi:exonuclease VII large subunit
LAGIYGSISLHDSTKILSLGYAIVSQENQILDKVSSIKKDKKITLQMQDGVVEVGGL